MQMHARRLALLAMMLASAAGLARPPRAGAFSGGITTNSFSAANGCNDCHSGGQIPTVTLTGPTSVDPGTTNPYTVTVSHVGAQDLAGFNVSAPDGVLATGGSDSAMTQALTGGGGRAEITHTGPKSSMTSVTTFTFLWTAPASFTTVTLQAWGNAVNGNLSTTGDHAARMTLDVANSTLPTAVPTLTPTPNPTPTDKLANPIPRPIRRGAKVALTSVATGFHAPVTATGAPGIDARYLYVVDQAGLLSRVDVTDGSMLTFLDVTSRLVPLGIFGPGSYDERGFLGVAFSPNYATNGLVYTFTSEPVNGTADFSTLPPGTPADCQSVITEWHVPNPTNADSVVDPMSARELLRVDKPQFNHNGGELQFSPTDGLLYASLGDGGGADDQDDQPFIGGPTVGHGPTGNGQNVASILGKIIRIDPAGTNSANGKYGIPADNPFTGMAGHVGEIYAYGLRNPFRFSFDSVTHDLYAGDVGQNDIEEVDIIRSGGNYGWNFKEGSFFFRPNGTGAGYVSKIDLGVPPGLIDPIAEYDHGEGISVIGGFVAHSPSLKHLNKHYVFGDLAKTFSNDGRLFYLRKRNLVRRDGKFQKSQIAEVRYPLAATSLGLSLLGFGQGNDGEIYALANTGATSGGTTGTVLRITEP